MITLIDGLTGSGKTWLTTKLARKEWRRGAALYINYAVKFSRLNTDITRWYQLDELYHLKNGVIVIDDAVKLLDARRWQSLPMSFAEKIAGHRHDHIDIITNIQDYNDIDVRVRQNIHLRYRCYSIFRLPMNDRLKPYLQLIAVTKKTRKLSADNDRITWRAAPRGKMQFYFLSRFFTREYYGTYENIYLDRYICKLIYDQRKPKGQQWQGKIYSRDLVNQGKARI